MPQAQFRSRRHLRPLRSRAMRRLLQAGRDGTHDLLRQLRDGSRAKRQGVAIDSPEKFTKRAGERVLFLSLRRIIVGGGGRRAFLSAVAVLDLVLWRMRRRLHRVGNLVWANREETKAMTRAVWIEVMKMSRHNSQNMKLYLYSLTLISAILLIGCVSNHPTVGAWRGAGFSPVRTDKIALTLRPNPNHEDAELSRVLTTELKCEGFNLVPLEEADYTLAYVVEDDSVENYVPTPQFTVSTPPQTTKEITGPPNQIGSSYQTPTGMVPSGYQQPQSQMLIVYHDKGIRLYLYTNPKTHPGGLRVAWSGCIEAGEKVSVEREPLLIQALLGHFGQDYNGHVSLRAP